MQVLSASAANLGQDTHEKTMLSKLAALLALIWAGVLA